MMTPTRRVLIFAIGCSFIFSGAVCSSGQEADTVLPTSQADPVELRTDALAKKLPTLLVEHAQNQAKAPTVRTFLHAEHQSAERTLHYPALLLELYPEEQRPLFVQGASLSPAGQQVLEVLQQSPKESLDPKPLHVAHIERLHEQLRERASLLAQHAASPPSLDALTRDHLLAQIRSAPSEQPQEQEEQQALQLVLRTSQNPTQTQEHAQTDAPQTDAPQTPLYTWYIQYRDDLTAYAEQASQLEAYMADGMLRYANEIRFSNPGYLSVETQIAQGPKAAARKELAALFEQVRQQTQEREVPALAAHLHSLRPPFAQYQGLIQALAHYRAIQNKGGWNTEDIPRVRRPRKRDVVRYSKRSRNIPRGMVTTLKHRLSGEGFFTGEFNDSWTDDFQEAVRKYRHSHQLLTRKVWIDYEMLESMRLPVEYRIAQIELNLQRWRRTRVHDPESYHIFVNLPDFHAEIWDKGERQMRFRVIVGSTKGYWNKDTGHWHFIDETPQFSNRVQSLVLNPEWNVPPRIRRQLQRLQEKDPEFYERNNYEVIYTAQGHELLRQKSGPGNALGQVKFLFPNQHDIYMHDTPNRDLFGHTWRAFSHGCIRVQDPLEVAAFLLKRDNPRWSIGRVKASVRTGKQMHHRLESQPEIHIEYYTVRVDEEGTPIFLSDIYEHDAHHIAKTLGLVQGLKKRGK